MKRTISAGNAAPHRTLRTEERGWQSPKLELCFIGNARSIKKYHAHNPTL